MAPSSPSRLREWADFNATGGELVLQWWDAYAQAYDAALKWSKKPTHVRFHSARRTCLRATTALLAAGACRIDYCRTKTPSPCVAALSVICAPHSCGLCSVYL